MYLYMGVLCCFALFVCLTLLASFFLPSHLSFKITTTSTCTSTEQVHTSPCHVAYISYELTRQSSADTYIVGDLLLNVMDHLRYPSVGVHV